MVVFARLAMPILPGAPWSLFGLVDWPTVSQKETEVVQEAEPKATSDVAAGGEIVPEIESGPDWRFADASAPMEGEAPVPPPLDALPAADSGPATAAPSTVSISRLRIATSVWIAGVAFLLARHIVSAGRFRRQRKSWQRVTDSPELALLRDCRRQLGLRR